MHFFTPHGALRRTGFACGSMHTPSGVAVDAGVCTLQIRCFHKSVSNQYQKTRLLFRMVWIHDTNAGGNQDGEGEGPGSMHTPSLISPEERGQSIPEISLSSTVVWYGYMTSTLEEIKMEKKTKARRKHAHSKSDVSTRAWEINTRDLASSPPAWYWSLTPSLEEIRTQDREDPKEACTLQVSYSQ